MAGMSLGQWRRWIQTHREVRVGRPIARDGHMAKNRRLTHTDEPPPGAPIVPHPR